MKGFSYSLYYIPFYNVIIKNHLSFSGTNGEAGEEPDGDVHSQPIVTQIRHNIKHTFYVLILTLINIQHFSVVLISFYLLSIKHRHTYSFYTC